MSFMVLFSANQEVIMELISFFHQALPEGLLPQSVDVNNEDIVEQKQLETVQVRFSNGRM